MDVHLEILGFFYSLMIITISADFIINLVLGVFCDVFKIQMEETEKRKLE